MQTPLQAISVSTMEVSPSAYLFKCPVKYGLVSILLYLISLEINNLMLEIREKSPVSSKQTLPNSLFTPEQITEARKHFTGFVKQAIVTTAARQSALSLAIAQLDKIKTLIREVEMEFSDALRNLDLSSKSGLQCLEAGLEALKKEEQDVVLIESKLRNMGCSINELIAKHRNEWQQLHSKYVQQLISELERDNIFLSELEKQELQKPTKVIDEVRANLVKHKIIKE